MKDFFTLYIKTLVRPTEAFRSLLSGNLLEQGFGYMMIPAILYTLMYIFLNLGGGAPSTFTPWLNISREEYYFYNQFLLAQSLLLSWFAAASFMQIISRVAGGSGTFEQTLAVTGLAISVAMWSTLLHDLLMSFSCMVGWIDARQHEIAMNSPTIWRTILWICFALYILAFVTLFTITIRTVHKLGWLASILTGLTGFILFQLIFLIFNR